MTRKEDANLHIYFEDTDGGIWTRVFENNQSTQYWKCSQTQTNTNTDQITNIYQHRPIQTQTNTNTGQYQHRPIQTQSNINTGQYQHGPIPTQATSFRQSLTQNVEPIIQPHAHGNQPPPPPPLPQPQLQTQSQQPPPQKYSEGKQPFGTQYSEINKNHNSSHPLQPHKNNLNSNQLSHVEVLLSDKIDKYSTKSNTQLTKFQNQLNDIQNQLGSDVKKRQSDMNNLLLELRGQQTNQYQWKVEKNNLLQQQKQQKQQRLKVEKQRLKLEADLQDQQNQTIKLENDIAQKSKKLRIDRERTLKIEQTNLENEAEILRLKNKTNEYVSKIKQMKRKRDQTTKSKPTMQPQKKRRIMNYKSKKQNEALSERSNISSEGDEDMSTTTSSDDNSNHSPFVPVNNSDGQKIKVTQSVTATSLRGQLSSLYLKIKKCKNIDSKQSKPHPWVPPFTSKKPFVFFNAVSQNKKEYSAFYNVFVNMSVTCWMISDYVLHTSQEKKGHKSKLIKIMLPKAIIDDISLWVSTIINAGREVAFWIISNLKFIHWHHMSVILIDLNKKLNTLIKKKKPTKQHQLPRKSFLHFSIANSTFEEVLNREFDVSFPQGRNRKEPEQSRDKEEEEEEDEEQEQEKEEEQRLMKQNVHNTNSNYPNTRSALSKRSVSPSIVLIDKIEIKKTPKKAKNPKHKNRKRRLKVNDEADTQTRKKFKPLHINLPSLGIDTKLDIAGIYNNYPTNFQNWYKNIAQNKLENKSISWNVLRMIIDGLSPIHVANMDLSEFILLFTDCKLQFRINNDFFCNIEKLRSEYHTHSMNIASVTSFPFNTALNFFVKHHPWLMRQQTHVTWMNKQNSQIICEQSWNQRKIRAINQQDQDCQFLKDCTMQLFRQKMTATEKITGLVLPVCINADDDGLLENERKYIFYCIHFIEYHELTIQAAHAKQSRAKAQFAYIKVYPLSIVNPEPEIQPDSDPNNVSDDIPDYIINMHENFVNCNKNLVNFLAEAFNNQIPIQFINIAEYEDFQLIVHSKHLRIKKNVQISIEPCDTAFALSKILDIFNDFVRQQCGKQTIMTPLKDENKWERNQIPLIYDDDLQLFRIQILHALNVRLKVLFLINTTDRINCSMNVKQKSNKKRCTLCHVKMKSRIMKNECKYVNKHTSGNLLCTESYCELCYTSLFQIFSRLLLDPKKKIKIGCYSHSSYKQKIIIYEYYCRYAYKFHNRLHHFWLEYNPQLCHYYSTYKILNQHDPVSTITTTQESYNSDANHSPFVEPSHKEEMDADVNHSPLVERSHKEEMDVDESSQEVLNDEKVLIDAVADRTPGNPLSEFCPENTTVENTTVETTTVETTTVNKEETTAEYSENKKNNEVNTHEYSENKENKEETTAEYSDTNKEKIDPPIPAIDLKQGLLHAQPNTKSISDQ